MTYGANKYKKMAVTTASKEQILLMLYEAAIKNVKKASECIEKNDVPGKGKYIGKTHDIVNELMNSLNFDIGGEIARELERLYNFVVEELVKANLENSRESLSAIEGVLSTLLEGWRGAVQEVSKQKKVNVG